MLACIFFEYLDDFPLANRPEKAADITQRHHVLRNEWRNSIWRTCHCPNMGNASDLLRQISFAEWPVRSTTHIWLETSNTSPICMFAFFLQTSLQGNQWWRCEMWDTCFLRLHEAFDIFGTYLYSKPTIPNLPLTRTLQIETLSILAAMWSGVWDAFPVMSGLQSSRLRKAWRIHEK